MRSGCWVDPAEDLIFLHKNWKCQVIELTTWWMVILEGESITYRGIFLHTHCIISTYTLSRLDEQIAYQRFYKMSTWGYTRLAYELVSVPLVTSFVTIGPALATHKHNRSSRTKFMEICFEQYNRFY